MAVAPHNAPSPLLTYEQYLIAGEGLRRYDIIDGVRILMPDPTRQHQRIVTKFVRLLGNYEDQSGRGQVIVAPSDILIRRDPLRTRQPDVLFISHERLARCAPASDPAPLLVGPELVIEVLSPSDTSKALEDKLADYRLVGVDEAWVVNLNARTVEVLQLTPLIARSVATYGAGEVVQSLTFSDLQLFVDSIFE